MGKKNRNRGGFSAPVKARDAEVMPPEQPSDAIQFATVVKAMDTYSNALARTGYGMPNVQNGATYPLTRLTQNQVLMTSLYRSSWIIGRIIDIKPEDMTKNWIQYTCELTPDELNLVQKNIKATKLKEKFIQAMKWGRLYGGAAAIMIIDGQEDNIEHPLDIDGIMPGDLKGFIVADRWTGIQPENTLVTDISDPDFGYPEFYRFTRQQPGSYGNTQPIRVHHSRVIRFTGKELPELEKQAEMYWGLSDVERVFEEVKKRDNTSANIEGLIFLANLRVMKMSDLGNFLGAAPSKVQGDFYSTLQAQNILANNFRMHVMNAEDDFEQFQLSNFTGINDVYESFMLDVSGSANIPVTRLFMRSPQGMNATGEGDMRNYYDHIEQEQESGLRPQLEKINPILMMSSIGRCPDDLEFIFNPVGTPTDKELADLGKAKAEIIFEAHSSGLASDQVAMSDLRTLGEELGLFTTVSDEDISAASNEFGRETVLPMSGDPDDPEGGLPDIEAA